MGGGKTGTLVNQGGEGRSRQDCSLGNGPGSAPAWAVQCLLGGSVSQECVGGVRAGDAETARALLCGVLS